jgi:hypothetical protein
MTNDPCYLNRYVFVFLNVRLIFGGNSCDLVVFSFFPRMEPKSQNMPKAAKVQEICFEYVKFYVMPVLSRKVWP